MADAVVERDERKDHEKVDNILRRQRPDEVAKVKRSA